MYAQSSQKRNWTFNADELINLRVKSNQDYIASQGTDDMDNKSIQAFFLNPYEESILLRQYELQLREFCKRFEPPMPKYTIGTVIQYFKRFYLYNSTMNYHPKEILATCVYLSCKVEEFNVSIQQFVANVKGDRNKAMDIILSNELLLMQELNFNLTIHNSFRPVEGFLIDIKTRCHMQNPDRLRKGIDEFLEKSFFTDACLIYSPSQIALAAVLHAASKEQENLDSYVTECLFANAGQMLKPLIEAVRKIRSMVKNISEMPDKNVIKALEKKLERCRNQANNPDSDEYKQRQIRELNDEDDDGLLPQQDEDVSMLNASNFD
ncbi:hypothetical protein PVAND_013655 [Polypedilum vanderplanki]|uniref:Cyclin-H n=1 Tax=Polypedilum vanderplanki TaxID=319348 RepID=A0A9J6CQY9_POLVA|nr:hypothetical protein PVAND_013655 [Polypedilum vanderplanki]